MAPVNVAEAKARLAELIDAALEGEEVIIARRNRPVVKLTALRSRANRRGFGALRGRIRISADFDEPLGDFTAYMPAHGTKGRRKR